MRKWKFGKRQGKNCYVRKKNSLQREIRFIITRLGSWAANPGAMVHGGTKVSQKCLGAEGNQISYNILHFKGEGCNISSHPGGQHDNPFILSENWGVPETTS